MSRTSRDFRFEWLDDIGKGLYERLVHDEDYHCRIYAPVGGDRNLPTYLARRLLEKGANSSPELAAASGAVQQDI